MFDAYEAVDGIIDEINENYNESCYEDIYNELCERVECGLLSVSDAELINEAAYEKYMMEASRMDKEALLLDQRIDKIERRLENETYSRARKYLQKKLYEYSLRICEMCSKGISPVFRAGKLEEGVKDAKRIARGEVSKVDGVRLGKIDAKIVKDNEGDKFSPYTYERKPGHYLRLQNSIR